MKSDDINRMIEEMKNKTPKAPEPINITNIPKTKPAATLKNIQEAVNALEKRINK